MAMSATVTITDQRTAEAFYRYAAPSLRGAGCWSAEEWMAAANRLAARIGPENSARVLRAIRAKGKHATFSGVRCKVCGCPLTNADSVLAGVGPKCEAA